MWTPQRELVTLSCGAGGTREALDQPESLAMLTEPLSPELALVDPELGARARATLPDPVAARRPVRPTPPVAAPVEAASPRYEVSARPYPLWARVTAALWLLVLGILIGGAAIPHAQDKPRLVPRAEDPPAAICEPPAAPTLPTGPIGTTGGP